MFVIHLNLPFLFALNSTCLQSPASGLYSEFFLQEGIITCEVKFFILIPVNQMSWKDLDLSWLFFSRRKVHELQNQGLASWNILESHNCLIVRPIQKVL